MPNGFPDKLNARGGSGGVSGLTTANAGDAIGDNQVIRGDGTTGIQGSAVTMSDAAANVVTVQGPSAGLTIIGGTATTADLTFQTTTGNAAAGGDMHFLAGNNGATEALKITNDGFLQLNPNTGIRGNNTGFGIFFFGTGERDIAFYNNTNSAASLRTSVGFEVVATNQFVWSANSDANATADTGFARTAAGVIRTSDSSTGVGAFLTARLVEANTAGIGAPNVLVAIESGTVLTNEGAAAENYHTLPTAVAGYEFTFIVQDADGIRITASGGDTIRPIAGTAASATGGFIRCATLGAFIRLQAINATEWIATGSAGLWTIDV